MVPIATNHATDIVDSDVLPGNVADVLPAGDLFENEQAQFVAGVEEVPRLRIVRRTDDVALEAVAQNLRVAALHAGGHRLSNKRECLMAVESAQLDDLAVEREPSRREPRLAESHAAAVPVDGRAFIQQLHVDPIQLGIFEIPQL